MKSFNIVYLVLMLFFLGCDKKPAIVQPTIVQVPPEPQLVLAAMCPSAMQWETQIPAGEYNLSLFVEEKISRGNSALGISRTCDTLTVGLVENPKSVRKIKIISLPLTSPDKYGKFLIKTDSSTITTTSVFDWTHPQEGETCVEWGGVSNSTEPLAVDKQIRLCEYRFQRDGDKTTPATLRVTTLYLKLTKR